MEFRQDTQNIFFPDQVEPIYDPLDPVSDYNFKEYWKRERDRCINGFYLADGQVFISGHLYFHCVYWKIAAYIEDEATGRKPRKIITPWLRDIDWDIINNDFVECEKQGRFYNLVGSRDFGKALINSASVYTDNGPIMIGHVNVGDRIFGADGKLTTVTGVYPQGKIDLFKITLRDGRVLYCCDEHIWRVWNSKKQKYENLPLKEIRKDYISKREKTYKNPKGVEYNYFIPNNEPVQYSENYLPIDPYFLGLWLGDGTKRTTQITTADREILDYITDYANKNRLSVKPSGKYGHNISSNRQVSKNPILSKLIEMDLLNNRHIPNAYILSSVEQRMELLRGLMDTDGFCSKKGVIEFSTTNPNIATGFYQLVRSLGIQVTYKKSKGGYRKNGIYKQTKDKYRFNLMTDKPVFKLKRKLEKIGRHRKNKTSIVDISYYGKDYATCITVDNQDKLFLTDNYTVTHNSIIAASRAGWLYTFFTNSESVISGGESTYIKLATDKIEDGLQNMHPVFKKQRLMSDWKKEVKAGWKEKKTNLADPRSSNSRILIRNYEMGSKTMAANGTRPGFHLIDEIGTIPNLIGCIKDSDGCWWSGGGNKPSCLVMVTGCVCAGTKVWTNSGQLVNIEDLKREEGILGYSGNGISKEPIVWMKPPAKKPCYRITTTGNNTIECSDDHPFLVSSRKSKTVIGKEKNVNRYSFVKAESIKPGNYLAVIDEVPVFGNVSLSDARLIGLMLGDGYFKGSTLSVDDEAIKEYILSNYSVYIKKEFETKEGVTYNEIGINGKQSLFRDLNLTHLTKDSKRIHDSVHELNKQSLSELLAGLFDSDGNVYTHKKKGTRIVLTNISKALLEDVKYQLLKFGIHCSIYKDHRNTKPQIKYAGQKDHIYRLYVSKNKDVERFIKSIPLLHSKKVKKLQEFKTGNRDFCTHKGVFRLTGEHSDEQFIKNNSLISGFKFETVLNVEYIGEKEVYNLNVGNTHTYIANGFITHNTGGDMQVGAEAAEVFFNPEAYNMLSFKNEWEGGHGNIGRFIPATRAKLKFKEPKTLADYLGISHPDLEKITILVSNEERALTEWWEPEYTKAVKSNNPKTILKFKAYWPLKPSDSFLRLSHNDFDITNAKKQQVKLRDKQITGIPVDLFYEDGKVTHKFNNRQAINQFPFKIDDEDVKKGTVIIYEPPVPFPPYGLYVGGVDPYKQDTAKYSDSLGAIYIFKRMHDIATEEYQDMIVAQYVGRPRSIDEWCETSRNLIKYYNAQTLVENEDIYFIKYMINKGDGHYLVDQPKWLIDNAGIANSSVKRDKGIHATPKIITYLNGVLKQYTEELRQTLRDENDSVIGDVRGMDHIFDPMLLEEMIQFSKGGNYDRIRAASLAIAQARHFDKNLKIKTLGGDSRLESVKKAVSEPASRTMFSSNRRKIFNNTKRLFR